MDPSVCALGAEYGHHPALRRRDPHRRGEFLQSERTIVQELVHRLCVLSAQHRGYENRERERGIAHHGWHTPGSIRLRLTHRFEQAGRLFVRRIQFQDARQTPLSSRVAALLPVQLGQPVIGLRIVAFDAPAGRPVRPA